MKKEDVLSLGIYLVMIAVAIITGLTVVQNTFSAHYNLGLNPYLFAIIVIVLGLLFNIVMLEVCHVIGAKIGKYKVISCNILGFCFYKDDDDKTKFRFASFDGLTGETKIVPKEDMVDKANPYPYLFFGSVFFVVEAIAIMVTFSIFRNTDDAGLKDVAYALLTIGAIGLIILIYNILPLRIDSMTDGYRLTMVSNPKNKAAFN